MNQTIFVVLFCVFFIPALEYLARIADTCRGWSSPETIPFQTAKRPRYKKMFLFSSIYALLYAALSVESALAAYVTPKISVPLALILVTVIYKLWYNAIKTSSQKKRARQTSV